MTNKLDVIIAGGGPAGTTAGTLLAQYGYKVLIVERDTHPRFHIGESMLPMGEPVFQRLGIEWDVEKYQAKGGAEFIDESTGQQAFFPLNGAFQPYQVERAELDLMLIKNAMKHGVDIHQAEIVRHVECHADGVEVRSDQADYTARYFIDATGRSAIMGRKKQSIDRIENLGRFALYTHYRGVCSEEAKALFATGVIKILILDIGWFWVIPLAGNRLSIGIVVQEDIPAKERGSQIFERYVASSPYLQSLLSGAEQESAVKTEADFSFSNNARYGVRYACCGDAAGFLDPVFSSGVFLALTSAERVADRIHQGFLDGHEADTGLHDVDDADYELGFDSMRGFVERFYNKGLVHNMFFAADRNRSIRHDIMGLLSGDLWTGNNEFQDKLLASKRAPSTIEK